MGGREGERGEGREGRGEREKGGSRYLYIITINYKRKILYHSVFVILYIYKYVGLLRTSLN